MGKKTPGLCDFIYLKGSKKGEACKQRGHNDKIGYRCKLHRLTKIKCWHGKRDKTSPPARARFDMMREEIARLRAIINNVTTATSEANALAPYPLAKN